jgi:hypothetical protein
MLRQIQDGFHAIFDSGRKGVLRCKAIIDADNDGPYLRYDRIAPTGIIASVPNGKAASVEVDYKGIFLALAAAPP